MAKMRGYNLVCPVVALPLVWFAIKGHPETLVNLVPVIASVSATMLGFLVTALSILMTLTGHRLIENMRRTGHLRQMVLGFFHSGVFFLASLIISLLFLMMPSLSDPWIGMLSMWLLTVAICLFIVGGWWFYLVVENLSSRHEPH
ncbi:DUF2254 domain-containing protein [Halothiobacillus diazotrophicus]|uniref:hypothetical protein n=1 Tax=Halothiobacillus diazotrophicus TaxID=1860122 RepID=UPI0012E906A8|nr:hypothetical protein [Halothiobacillus diazotrophicus]